MASEAKLAGFERVMRVHLEPQEWTPDTFDLMTPTMKTKRPQASSRPWLRCLLLAVVGFRVGGGGGALVALFAAGDCWVQGPLNLCWGLLSCMWVC